MKRQKVVLSSYIYAVTVKVRDLRQISVGMVLHGFIAFLCKQIRMKPMGNGSIDTLPSKMRGFFSFSVNQPIKTSIISLDTWPEHSSFVLLVHSCRRFDPKKVDDAVKLRFRGARILKRTFTDHSLYENG